MTVLNVGNSRLCVNGNVRSGCYGYETTRLLLIVMALLQCPECGASVSEHASVCPNCGAQFHPTGRPQGPVQGFNQQVYNATPQRHSQLRPDTVAPKKESSNTASTLLLIYLVLKVFIVVVSYLISWLSNNYIWPAELTWYMFGVTDILGGLTIFLPACAIKDKTLKIIGLIIASILAIWWTLNGILHMTRVW